MNYRRTLPNGLLARLTQQGDADQLEKLQEIVFPTLAPDQRLKAPHYRKHIELFPEGQLVVVDTSRVVGMTTTIRLKESFLAAPHRFEEVIAGGFCTSHDPQGEWLYGADMGTHPDYRGRGIARALYVARHELVRKLGLKGQYTMGMPTGYGAVKDRMSAEEYYSKLIKGEIQDPTVSAQMKIGFEPYGLVEDYLDDPVCGNYCIRLKLPAEKEIADDPKLYR